VARMSSISHAIRADAVNTSTETRGFRDLPIRVQSFLSLLYMKCNFTLRIYRQVNRKTSRVEDNLTEPAFLSQGMLDKIQKSWHNCEQEHEFSCSKDARMYYSIHSHPAVRALSSCHTGLLPVDLLPSRNRNVMVPCSRHRCRGQLACEKLLAIR
jgi:hypothetical protein